MGPTSPAESQRTRLAIRGPPHPFRCRPGGALAHFAKKVLKLLVEVGIGHSTGHTTLFRFLGKRHPVFLGVSKTVREGVLIPNEPSAEAFNRRS